MRNLRWPSAGVLVVAMLAIWYCGPVFGQKLQVKGRALTFYSVYQPIPHAIDSAAPTFANRKFWILRIAEPFSLKNFNECQKAGIQLGKALGDGLYEACLPLGLPLNQLPKFGFISIAPFGRELVLDPSLTSASFRVSTVGQFQIQILPHSGLKEDLIRQFWQPHWGNIDQVWQGQLTKWIVTCNMMGLDAIASAGWAQWIEPADAAPIPYNNRASGNSRVNYLVSSSFGLNSGLTGNGITVAVGDGGMVETHADLELNQENFTPNKIGSFADHQDHVSGTIAGAGVLQEDKRGMAPGVRLLNLQTSSVLTLGVNLSQNQGVTLTNNSYGQPLMCSRAGTYSATSAYIDDQAFYNPTLTHVFAAGNQGNVQCGAYPAGFSNIAEGYPICKNVITVGAVLHDDAFAWFSSAGPAKDGRVKPEIVANGNNVVSTVPLDNYATKGGTSMATPVVTGALALLSERYRQLYGNLPESALLKAIVCNSADDLGLPHVDFKYGYGRLNGRRALKVIENQAFKPFEVFAHSEIEIPLPVPAGVTGARFVLSWADPAGTVATVKSLVNNLDLMVTNAQGQTFKPWVADHRPANVQEPATRNIDTLNNLEQVTMPVVAGQQITLKVKASQLVGGLQKCWITYVWEQPELVLTAPVFGQMLPSGSTFDFRWDETDLQINEAVLQQSSDSLFGWTDFQTIASPGKQVASFLVGHSPWKQTWFRIKAQTTGGVVHSLPIKVYITQQPQLEAQVCEKTIRLQWKRIPTATSYQLFGLDRELKDWKLIRYTADSSAIISGAENGSRNIFCIRPWFDNKPGLRSDGIIAVPQTGTCNWANDIGLSSWVAPQSGRMFTSTQFPPASPVKFKLRNYGNNGIDGQPVTIHCKFPDGTIQNTTSSVYLQPGEEQLITLPWALSTSIPGQFPVLCWLSGFSDSNASNDSLRHTVEIFPNAPIILPWSFDGEEMEEGVVANEKLGVFGVSFLDFASTNRGEIKSRLPVLQEGFGHRSLLLDKQRIDGSDALANCHFTLNLSHYATADQLILDFDWISYGLLAPGNILWARMSDAGEWKEIMSLASTSSQSGVLHQVRGINLRSFFPEGEFTSSFQLRFSASVRKPAHILMGEGFAVDNFILSIPTRDVVVSKLINPAGGCQSPGASQHVTVLLKNVSQQTTGPIEVGYQLAGSNSVSETIPGLGAGDSLVYTFSAPLPFDLVGKLVFKCWARAEGDGYPANDTVRNIQVFIAPNVTHFPYYQDFESTDGFWNSYGNRSSWAWGTPSGHLSVVDTAANGNRIWKTNLGGDYNTFEESYLQSPCFNLNNLEGDIQVSFNSIFNTETDYDFAWLEISEDGRNWTRVGQKSAGTNWYNHDSHQWNGLRKYWETTGYRISPALLSQKGKVQFRFGFSADASLTSEGFGLDDFHIESAFSVVADTVFKQTIANPEILQWRTFGSDSVKAMEVQIRPEMGKVTLQMRRNTGAVRFYDKTPYLDRNFLIVPDNQPDEPVLVRLFITDSDVKRLVAVDGNMNSFQQLGIFKYDGPNEDLDPTNNDYLTGNIQFIPAWQVLKTPTAGGYFLEFSVSSFSEFYIASQPFSEDQTPLGIKLISFTAKPDRLKSKVTLSWITASEINCDRFEISYSGNGTRFSPLGTFMAKGGDSQTASYSIEHFPEFYTGGQLIYRLDQFDVGSNTPQTFYQKISNPALIKAPSVQNPISEKIQLFNLENETTEYQIVDASGKLVLQGMVLPDGSISAGTLSPGLYQLVIHWQGNQKLLRLLKE